MSLVQTGGSLSTPRSARRRTQDPERRLGDSKNATVPDAGSSSQAITIVVKDDKDDDDEVQVSSPRSIAHARTSGRSRRNRPPGVPVVGDDADLELRLGTSGTGPLIARGRVPASLPGKIAGGAPFGVSRCPTIDLTSANDDFEVPHTTTAKRKYEQSTPELSKDIKLTCAICMDTMKEETSTVCGHIFCRPCIIGAIQAQKKCPTCRKKLTNSNIHRIYLSSGSR